MGLNPPNDFFAVEGLGDVVHRYEIEVPGLVLLISHGGNENGTEGVAPPGGPLPARGRHMPEAQC